MVAISMYRGNLHRVEPDTVRPLTAPRPTISPSRFRRLVRSRSLAVSRLIGGPQVDSPASSPDPRPDEGAAAEPVGHQADEVDEEVNYEGEQQQQPEEERQQEEEQPQQEEHEEEEEHEEGAVEDVDMDMDMDDAGEVVVAGDDADGNADPEEGQGESEGFDPNPEVTYVDGAEDRKRELSEKLDTLNKKKHDLVQMLKQVLNAEEEIRTRGAQASMRAAMSQPSENAADGTSLSRQAPRMTVDVSFSDVAGESDAGSNQGTPGRPLHHVHSISPSTASFARSPFGSHQYNSGYTPRSPATFSTASPSRFAVNGHQGHLPSHPSVSLPGSNFVASSPSPAASGGSSSVFRDYRPPNST